MIFLKLSGFLEICHDFYKYAAFVRAAHTICLCTTSVLVFRPGTKKRSAFSPICTDVFPLFCLVHRAVHPKGPCPFENSHGLCKLIMIFATDTRCLRKCKNPSWCLNSVCIRAAFAGAGHAICLRTTSGFFCRWDQKKSISLLLCITFCTAYLW